MDRRHFLSLASIAALGALASGCAPGAGYDAESLARPALLDALGTEKVRAIGERYRETMRDERDARAIRAAILDSRPFGARFLGAAAPPVAELVRADFANGRTVVVDGWVLAATEARQCALFSLLPA